MKKLTRGFIGVMMVMCCTTACGNDKPTVNVPVNRPAATTGNQEQQTLSNMRVYIKDITAYAGEDIDYIGAIESAENLELNRSMIYVDSSLVDNHTPGVYKALYTFDYMGSTVSSATKVTILENQEPATEPVTEETTTEEATTETTTEISSETLTETETTETTGTSTEETTSVSETETPAETTIQTETESVPADTQATVSTEPVTAVVEQPLSPAQITLASGRVVTINMTSSRYITETYTDETYYEEDGLTFLTSELKVVFNTGEVQVVETVVTRVQPQETSTATETSAAQ